MRRLALTQWPAVELAALLDADWLPGETRLERAARRQAARDIREDTP